jgi:hypothetical protein
MRQLKTSLFAVALALTGCAELNMGWYKPGVSQQDFNQDKFACMSGSQMQVATSNINGTGSTYYNDGNVTCNTYGSTTNCSGGGGYSAPGQVIGSSASYTTTNMPLFQACMQARGYVWTSQTQVQKYEASQAVANYTPPPPQPRAPAIAPSQSDAWYQCMKAHNWDGDFCQDVRPTSAASANPSSDAAWYDCMNEHKWNDTQNVCAKLLR